MEQLPVLSPEEQRVIGSLIEKSRATPEYYPMTVNSLLAACNQKSSRKPVVSYDENTLVRTLNELKKRGLIATVTGGTSRTIKWKHNLAVYYPLIPAQLAVICLLLLRGPLTPGEINSNSGRLYEFETLEEVQEILDQLMSAEPAFVVQLPRRAGQKEVRFMHLLGGTPDPEDYAQAETDVAAANPGLENRIAALEAEVAGLRLLVDELRRAWNG